MTATITLDKAKELVRDAVARFPNRVNPTRESGAGSCVYTSASGKTHCIAGQILSDLGLPVPEFEVYGDVKDVVEPDWFTDDALDYLLAAQAIFDGGYAVRYEEPRSHVGPRKWSTALKLLEKATDGQ